MEWITQRIIEFNFDNPLHLLTWEVIPHSQPKPVKPNTA